MRPGGEGGGGGRPGPPPPPRERFPEGRVGDPPQEGLPHIFGAEHRIIYFFRLLKKGPAEPPWGGGVRVKGRANGQRSDFGVGRS